MREPWHLQPSICMRFSVEYIPLLSIVELSGMLQRIRERISGWVSILVIVLVGGAFILFGVEYYFQQGGAGDANTAATVNGTVISQQQLSDAISALRQQMGAAAAQPNIQEQLKDYALQNLITETALLTTLENEGFDVAVPQIKAFVMQAPIFQDNGQFSEQKFQQFLMQASESPEQFFDRVRSQFIVQGAMQGVGISAFVLPSEVDRIYALQHQSRAFGYFLLPAKSFENGINISDAQVAAYYKANAENYQTPAKAQFSYVLLSPADLAKSVSVSATEVKSYYDAHLTSFTTPVRYEVSQITVPVGANADDKAVAAAQTKITEIAKNIAQHKKLSVASASMTLSTAAIPLALQTMLSQMKVGQTSEPLRTQNGFTLLTLTKVLPAETKSFSDVDKQINTMLVHQKISALLSKDGAQLSNLTYTHPDSLVPAAQALGLTVQQSPMMTNVGEKTGVFSQQSVLQAIFSSTVLQSANNSAVIPLQDGSQLVVRVLKQLPAQAVPLATVRAKIQNILLNQQAAAKAGVIAYQLQSALATGGTPEALAKKYKLDWHQVSLISFGQKTAVLPDILKAAFTTPITQASNNKLLGAQSVMINNSDYAVVGVSQVVYPKATAMDDKTRAQETTALTNLWGQLLQHSFVNSVLKQSKIKVNP